MLGFILFLITVSYMFLFIKGYPYMVIYKKVNNGIEYMMISSRVEAESGTNFSLICRVFNTRNKDFNNEVFWSRKRGRFKSANEYRDNKISENITNGNLLNFDNVTLKHQGTYFCTSIDDVIFKKISVYIDPHNKIGQIKERYNRIKRDDGNYYNYGRKDDGTPYWAGNQDSNYGNSLSHNSYDNRDNNQRFKQEDILPKFLYMMLGGFGVFLLIYLVTKCCHENNENVPNTTTNRQRHWNRNDRAPCLHAVCVRNRYMNPNDGCLLVTTPETTPALTNNRVNDTYFNIPITTVHNVDDEVLRECLDLPPTYEHSTANSVASSTLSLNDTNDRPGPSTLNSNNANNVCALPPTYEEALANPNSQICENSSSNVVHTASGGGDSGGGGGDSGGGGGDSGGGGGDSGGGGGDSGGGGGDSGGGYD